MQQIVRYIKQYKHMALLWLVVFSMAPCTVKEGWSSVAGLDYSKPLNRSQTTASMQQCPPAGLSESKQIAPRYQVSEKFPSFSPHANNYPRASSKKRISIDPGYYPGSGPPPYILYKRLKLGMV